MPSLVRVIKRQLGLRWQKHRSRVGIPAFFDPIGLSQFELLRLLGLSPGHFVLDIGCGALAAGKYLIPFLEPRHYFAIEPQTWLVDAGLRYELSRKEYQTKLPTFDHNYHFNLSIFGQEFDFQLAHSIFSHASRTQIRKAFDETSRVMRKSGIFAASYVKGESDYEGSDWVAPGVVRYTPQAMEAMAAECGLAVCETRWPHLPHPHPTQTWILICHPENQEHVQELQKRVNERAATFVVKADPQAPAWVRRIARKLRNEAGAS